MRIEWSPLAIQRVHEAADHIGQDSIEAATKWAEGIFDAASGLEELPERGRVVPEVGRPEIRELLLGNYRVIYRVGEDEVAIVTNLRQSRRLQR